MYIVLSAGPPNQDLAKQPKPTPEDETAFYYYFGAAMASWQDIEVFLSLLYVHITKPEYRSASLAALYKVHSFRTRINMVDVAIEHRYANDKKILQEWKRLSDRIQKKSKRRNMLAHLVCYFDPAQKPNGELFLGQSMIAAPPDADKTTWIKDRMIDVGQLREIGEEFYQAQQEMVAFGQSFPEPLLT